MQETKMKQSRHELKPCDWQQNKFSLLQLLVVGFSSMKGLML